MVPRVRICGFWPKKNDRIDENFFLGGFGEVEHCIAGERDFCMTNTGGWLIFICFVIFCLFARFNPL